MIALDSLGGGSSGGPRSLLWLLQHGFAAIEVQTAEILRITEELGQVVGRSGLGLAKLEPVPPFNPGPEPDRSRTAHHVAWFALHLLSETLGEIESNLLGLLVALPKVLIIIPR